MLQPISKSCVMPNHLSNSSVNLPQKVKSENINKYHKLPNIKQELLKDSIRIAFTAIALSLSIAIPSQAASVSYSGDTTNAATFNRPQTQGFEGGTNPPTSLSSNGTAVTYSSQPFFVDTTSIYNVTGSQNFLGIQFLYANSFNPDTPLVNLLSGNDPFPDEGVSGFSNLSLTANNQYFLVTTGFDNTNLSFGTFTNTISGTGNITLGNTVTVPEPSFTPSIVAFAIAGTTLVLKRQIKKPKFIPPKNGNSKR
jgi:hypothetical protein